MDFDKLNFLKQPRGQEFIASKNVDYKILDNGASEAEWFREGHTIQIYSLNPSETLKYIKCFITIFVIHLIFYKNIVK